MTDSSVPSSRSPDPSDVGPAEVRPTGSRLFGDGRSSDGSSSTEDLQHEVDHLRRMVLTLPVIEQAKGVLMHRYEINAHTAFELLARWSQALEQRVSILAQVVLEIAQVTDSRTADLALVEALKAQMGGER